MYKNVMQSIDGIDIYPIISLAIFGLFFLTVFVYIAAIRKSTIEKIKHLPLDDQEMSNEENERQRS